MGGFARCCTAEISVTQGIAYAAEISVTLRLHKGRYGRGREAGEPGAPERPLCPRPKDCMGGRNICDTTSTRGTIWKGLGGALSGNGISAHVYCCVADISAGPCDDYFVAYRFRLRPIYLRTKQSHDRYFGPCTASCVADITAGQ